MLCFFLSLPSRARGCEPAWGGVCERPAPARRGEAAHRGASPPRCAALRHLPAAAGQPRLCQQNPGQVRASELPQGGTLPPSPIGPGTWLKVEDASGRGTCPTGGYLESCPFWRGRSGGGCSPRSKGGAGSSSACPAPGSWRGGNLIPVFKKGDGMPLLAELYGLGD